MPSKLAKVAKITRFRNFEWILKEIAQAETFKTQQFEFYAKKRTFWHHLRPRTRRCHTKGKNAIFEGAFKKIAQGSAFKTQGFEFYAKKRTFWHHLRPRTRRCHTKGKNAIFQGAFKKIAQELELKTHHSIYVLP